MRGRTPAARPSRGAPLPRQGGFTVVEMVISLFVLALVLVGVLSLFDLNNRLARVQTHVAEMQQSIRIAQYDMVRMVRMAGRGGLPRGQLTQGGPGIPGIAVGVRNNVPASGDDHFIAVADASSPEVLAGTDVLTVRGVFTSPLYQVNPAAGNLILDGTPPTSGSVRIQDPNPNTGIPQDLQPLIDAVNDGIPEAFVVVDPLDVWVVVEIDATHPRTDVSNPDDITVGFQIGTVGGSATVDKYAELSGGFPATFGAAAAAGILEEYRFYVREEYAIPGDKTSDLTPRLSRARFYPGTETAHPDTPGFAADIADNIFDIQVALGVDTDNPPDGNIQEGDPPSKTDDWLYNADQDDDTDAGKWDLVGGGVPPLYYVRITTLARTDRRDPRYQAPLLTVVEDKDYSAAPFNKFNTREERMFRRRFLQTVVDLRNLS